jgi:hypothetical protein
VFSGSVWPEMKNSQEMGGRKWWVTAGSAVVREVREEKKKKTRGRSVREE